MTLDSGSDSDIEKVWQAPELGLLDFQLMLRVLLAQSYPLSLVRAPSSSFEPYLALHAVTQSQCFMVRSAHASSLEIIRASWRRSYMNFGDGVEQSALDDVCVYAGEAELSIGQVSSEDILIHVMGIILWMSRNRDLSCSMVLDSGFDLNDETMLQASELEQRNEGFDDLWRLMDDLELDEGIGWSIRTGSVKAAKYIHDFMGSVSTWKNSVRRARPLFTYLVIWMPKDYIARAAQYFYGGWQAKVDRAEGHVIEFLWNCASFML